MNYWIFQATPERFDLRKQLEPGQTVTWYATRYINQMTVGDIVFFWLAGDEEIRGIYGWGEIKTRPYRQSDSESYGVDVVCIAKLNPFLPAKKISSMPALQEMLILRVRQGANFLLSEEEGRTLSDLAGISLEGV